MTAPTSIAEIVEGLANAAADLAMELLPGGRREGREWVCPSASSPFGCSVGVHLHHPRAGLWCAWASGVAGDALDLVAQVKFSGDPNPKSEALKWAKEWLRLPVREAQASRRRDGGNLAPPRTARALGEEATSRAKQAKALWLGCEPRLGWEAQTYLRSRAVDLTRLGRQPRALRWHPRLWHPPSREHWPAIVAAVMRAGELVAAHRTWLRRDGAGKAPVENPKMTRGGYLGGCIPLWRGASKKPLKDAVEGETVLISEGIEDGLTAAIAAPEYRVLCALSLMNLGAIELPAAIRHVVILGQNDPWWSDKAGLAHGAARGLDRAVRRFQSQGRTVRLARTETGKDINDLVREVAVGVAGRPREVAA